MDRGEYVYIREGKPPVLSEEELEPIYNKCVEDKYLNSLASEVAKAQRDADIRWYEEE